MVLWHPAFKVRSVIQGCHPECGLARFLPQSESKDLQVLLADCARKIELIIDARSAVR
jgi:hypothetical protein